MKRRNKVKNITYGILSSFLSRNNDIDGYWALGIFYKVASENRSLKFELNLLRKDSKPYYKDSNHVATFYQNYLYSQIQKQKLKSLTIFEAKVFIEFEVEPEKSHINRKYTWGKPFNCRVELVDEKGTIYNSNGIGWCDKHNPKVERRSTRRLNS